MDILYESIDKLSANIRNRLFAYRRNSKVKRGTWVETESREHKEKYAKPKEIQLLDWNSTECIMAGLLSSS